MPRQRVVMSIMGFLSVVVSYTMRTCLSVAITEMTEPIVNTNKVNRTVACDVHYLQMSRDNKTHTDGIRYHWTQQDQGWILSSFYIGYLLTHIPGGLLAEKFGAKWPLSLGILIIAICNAAIPLTLRYGEDFAITLMITLRIIMGLAGGTTFPSLSVLVAAWIPENERSNLGSFVLGGAQFGSILSFYISGLLLTHWKWPIVFYFWSVVATIWFIIFSLVCYSDPASHPFISREERNYLKAEMGQIQRYENLPSTPWKKVLTSSPVFALICGQIGHDWIFYIMASDLPKYMKEVLGYSVHDVGLYSSLPYGLMWAISIASGFLCDYLIKYEYVTITTARKIFAAFASAFPATFILIASYGGCNRLIVVASFIIAMGFMGNFYPGMKVNSIDLSPNYAGSLMALTNGLGALTGITAPVFVGFMTPDSSLEQWRFVFWATFGFTMVRTLIFSIWASGKAQPWNSPKRMPARDESEKLTNTNAE